MQQPQTINELKESGYKPQTVKAELRANLIRTIRGGERLFTGIIGYDHTVLPEIENAILACHDIILLGERGQAKTRIMRSLTALLDDALPVIAGCEINDNPFHPLCEHCRREIAARGGETAISWIPRRMRFSEKLATPDVTIADLIGDVDPIKIAEGRYLSDELAIHYGLVPRTNRGIFAINELPDLHEKIQVGLFNLLEERDVQIRGYKVALPLDIVIIATANPEDYTSRGRIITPLKDRFGAQIRTHYPPGPEDEISIVRQEKAPFAAEGFRLILPHFMEEIIAAISQLARSRPGINHSSGISVRMSIHNMETLISNAFRRSILLGEEEVVPRISDLSHLLSSMKGKIEWDFTEEGGEAEKITTLIRDAVSTIFRNRFPREAFDDFLHSFSTGSGIVVSETDASSSYLAKITPYASLRVRAEQLIDGHSPALLVSAAEFILEGLAIGGKIKKEMRDTATAYSSRQ